MGEGIPPFCLLVKVLIKTNYAAFRGKLIFNFTGISGHCQTGSAAPGIKEHAEEQMDLARQDSRIFHCPGGWECRSHPEQEPRKAWDGEWENGQGKLLPLIPFPQSLCQQSRDQHSQELCIPCSLIPLMVLVG